MRILLLLPIFLAACTQQSAFQSAKNLECQQNGGTATTCARSYSQDYHNMQNAK
jgi:outer membrane lipoprotein-sorting protein